ncbi:MAG: 2-isopropylmalate synthase, partial [Clostridia bacterium]
MEKIIKLLDTTLRDGEQMPGVNLNESDKLRIAYSLAHLGVDAVEAGFPSSSISDFNAVFKIAEQISGTKIVALARAEQKDIDAAYRALKPALDKRIHIFIATSDLHIEQKLNMTRGEVLNRVRQCVTYAKTLFDDVEFSPEDASRSDLEYMISVLKTATECGANVINIPDTVGYSTPTEFGELVKIIKQRVIGTSCVELSVHCHNDLGLAVANTLSAIQNGADWVDCTINGLGERAGNAALEEIVMALDTRKTFFGVTTSVNTTLLSKTSKLVSSITGVYIPP